MNSSKSTAAFDNDDQEAALNSDFTQVVTVNTEQMDWEDSPMPNVWRKRLELISTSNPQLTTVVKFTPDSYFKAHQHDGGEEFLVLEGVFSDSNGDFPYRVYKMLQITMLSI